MIERNLLASDAKKILKMFKIFRDTAVRYGLSHNETFSEAFKDFNFGEMARLVAKLAVAKEILNEYV